MNNYYQSLDNIFFKNKFMKNFYQIMLSQNLINIAVALTISTSFTDIIKAINDGLIVPILTIFSKNRKFFQIAPIISNIFLFVIVTFLVYVLILIPINNLRNRILFDNKEE
jgi:large-conductance mechanosensitive channel